MKPIHAKPQSGQAIEPGLVLRIVSKRGRTVMFGQTGLLFANRQWVTQHINSKKVTLSYPLQFGQVLVTIAGVETATYVSCETSNSNAIVEAVWFDSTYPDTNIVHVIAIGQ